MDNKKHYKIKLEVEEQQTLKLISCLNNLSIQKLMERIIREFIAFQEGNPKPIRRKKSDEFINPHKLNVPVSLEMADLLLKHKKEEGVSIITIITEAVAYWFRLHKIDPKDISETIDIKKIDQDKSP